MSSIEDKQSSECVANAESNEEYILLDELALENAGETDSATSTSLQHSPSAPQLPKASIHTLATESIVAILEFLRAIDLCAVSETDKTIFSQTRIKLAISFQLNTLYPLHDRSAPSLKPNGSTGNFSSPLPSPPTPHGSYLHTYYLESQRPASPSVTRPGSRSASPSTRQDTPDITSPFSAQGLGIDLLYTREIKSIIAALSSPQPLAGRMFWISTAWVANARKFYEAMTLPEPTKKGKGQRKVTKIRVRRGSDALPPWPQMNADLTCVHDQLALAKSPKGKRRLLSAHAWNLLRKFYPSGPSYYAGIAGRGGGAAECSLCSRKTSAQKQEKSEQREKEATRRADLVPPELASLFSRKSGIPTEYLARRRALYVEDDKGVGGMRGSGMGGIGMGVGVAGGPRSPLYLGVLTHPPHTKGFNGYIKDATIPIPHTGTPPSPSPIIINAASNSHSTAYGRPPLSRSGSFSLSPFQESYSSQKNTEKVTENGFFSTGKPTSYDTKDRELQSLQSCASLDSTPSSGYGDYEFSDDDQSDWEFIDCDSMGGLGMGGAGGMGGRGESSLFPLLPGIYHLVPREWTRRWRHYIKDPSSSSVPLLDCSSLLCHSHGLVVVPPHVEEYLIMGRKTLLGGLGRYGGEVVEIITLAEWEALHAQLKSIPDFSIQFSLTDSDISWNVGVCQACDRLSYGNMQTSRSPGRRERRPSTGEGWRG